MFVKQATLNGHLTTHCYILAPTITLQQEIACGIHMCNMCLHKKINFRQLAEREGMNLYKYSTKTASWSDAALEWLAGVRFPM